MFYMSPISATPQTSLHATRLEHPPIRIFTESLHDFSPAEDPRSPLRLQRSPVDASPSALLTPAQSSYTASSPSNNGSVPPITPLSPYNHLYFATPLIRPSSQSPLSLAGGSISPTALTFKVRLRVHPSRISFYSPHALLQLGGAKFSFNADGPTRADCATRA